MVDLRNPAARLNAFLMKMPRQDQSSAPFVVACRLWELDPEKPADQTACIARVGDVVGLGVSIRQRAEAAGKIGRIALTNFDQVETTLFNFGGLLRSHQLTHVMEPMQPTAWTSLAQLQEVLDDEQPLEVDESTRFDLEEQLLALIASVHAAGDLDPYERMAVLEHLLQIKEMLRRVDIVGPERVEAATDGLMGALVRLSLRSRAFRTHPVVAECFKLVGAIAVVYGLAADWHALAASGFAALVLPASGGGDGGGDGGGGST